MQVKTVFATSALALSFAAAAPAGQVTRDLVEQDQVMVTYQASLGPKQLSGVSRTLVGTVEEGTGGALHISARVPVASFESGSAGIDALFVRALEGDRFPDVSFEGEAVAPRKSGPFSVNAIGTLSVHGVSQRVAVPIKGLRDGKTLFVKAAFPIDFAAYGLAVPSIAGRSISPRTQIELHALLRPAAPPEG